jgi:hypothetical protein
MASGESFDQMLRRVEAKRAGAAAQGVMPMAAKSPSKDDKGFAPAQKSNLAPPFQKKGLTKKKGFAPAGRSMAGGRR